jgi:hypothetical protein
MRATDVVPDISSHVDTHSKKAVKCPVTATACPHIVRRDYKM